MIKRQHGYHNEWDEWVEGGELKIAITPIYAPITAGTEQQRRELDIGGAKTSASVQFWFDDTVQIRDNGGVNITDNNIPNVEDDEIEYRGRRYRIDELDYWDTDLVVFYEVTAQRL